MLQARIVLSGIGLIQGQILAHEAVRFLSDESNLTGFEALLVERSHLDEVRQCVEDGRVTGGDKIEAFYRAFLRRIIVGFGWIRAMRIEFVYGRYLKELEEVSVDNQLDFCMVPVAFSANSL